MQMVGFGLSVMSVAGEVTAGEYDEIPDKVDITNRQF